MIIMDEGTKTSNSSGKPAAVPAISSTPPPPPPLPLPTQAPTQAPAVDKPSAVVVPSVSGGSSVVAEGGGNKKIFILVGIVVLVVIVLIVSAYFLLFKGEDSGASAVSRAPVNVVREKVTPLEQPTPTPATDPTAGWINYTSDLGYILRVPLTANLNGVVTVDTSVGGKQETLDVGGYNLVVIKNPNLNTKTNKAYASLEEYDSRVVDFESLSVGDVQGFDSGLYLDAEEGTHRDVIFIIGESVWEITVEGIDSEDLPEIDLIIGTFGVVSAEEELGGLGV